MKFKLKILFINLIIILLLLFSSIIIFEFILRIAKIEYPIFQRHDELLGFSLRPNTSGKWTREGNALVKINSEGFRDFEHNIKKDKNIFRIAILGDSFAEARSVNVEKTFWYLMHEKLKKCKNINNTIEVINFGVTEYSTAQQYLILKSKVWKYEPDLVLLTFFSETNISSNSKKLSRKKYRPFFILENDKLILDNSFKETKPYMVLSSSYGKFLLKLSDYSRSAQLFRELYVKNFFKKTKDNNNEVKKISKKNITRSAWFNPQNKDWKDAWNLTEKLILEINDEVKSKNEKFLLVTLGAPFQVHPEKKYRDDFIKKNYIKNIFYAEDRLANLGEKNNFKVVNLAKVLQKKAIKFKKYYHGFKNTKLGEGHLNEDGHYISSEVISNKVCKLYN